MKTFVCQSCFECYHEHISNGSKCPKTSCSGSTLEIDEYLVSPITELWKVGVKTLYSCSGHLHISGSYPYVDLDCNYPCKDSKMILKSIKQIINKYSNVRSGYADGDEHRSWCRGELSIHVTWNGSETTEGKLEDMRDFVLFLFALAKEYRYQVETTT